MIADDENLDTAAELGFANHPTATTAFWPAKYNDGLQLACDPSVNPRPADYAVPMGSDDWLDYRILLRLPPRDAVLCFRQVAFVSEDGRTLTETVLRYEGGVGIRVYPRQLLEPSGYRPGGRGSKASLRHLDPLQREAELPPPHERTCASSTATCTPARSWTGRRTALQLNAYSTVAHRHRAARRGRPLPAPGRPLPAEALERDGRALRPGAGMKVGGKYRVVSTRRYRGHRPGDLFEARLDYRAEARAIGRGDIVLIERITPAVQPGSLPVP